MMTAAELERDRYELRLKGERKYRTLLVEAEQSRTEGRMEGRIEGALIGRIQFAKQYLRQPITSWDELVKMSTTDLQAIAAGLEKSLGLTE